MSKLSFRARALDASKPMPIFMAEELPDLPDYSAINRAVPQMPTGMQKEEECEHHLQRAIVAGLIIPTPEVTDIPNKEFYDNVYPANYKQPRQLIHMQPFTMEQDIPDYDMDSDDERWLQSQTQKLELSELKFEEMMDRLEKSSGQTVVTLNEAKALLKEDDDLIIAVFDYWLNKRLKTQHPLILTVKTEHRVGQAANNPYLAFRRRTEKMQTRKNRKNDEASYEKMLKLRRDLCRAVTLLELVKRREKMKREYVHLTVEVFEKRYLSKDFSGSIVAEAAATKSTQQQQQTRPAFTQIFHNHYTNHHQQWSNKATLKDEVIPRREKRQYKKRKHKSLGLHGRQSGNGVGVQQGVHDLGVLSSDDDTLVTQLSPESDEIDDEGQFAFRRNKFCSYHMPLSHEGNWPWHSQNEHGMADKRYRFTLTSLSNPRPRCIGFARRRMGRGGRIVLDRVSTNYDDYWRTLDFSIYEPQQQQQQHTVQENKVKLVDNTSNNTLNNNNNNNSVLLRTDDIKYDLNHFNSGSSDINNLRTSVSDINECMDDGNVKYEVKKEPIDEQNDDNNDDMVEFLRSLRRDWLHFRPKTPPNNYESPCNLLENDDQIFTPCANQSFSMEIIPIEPPSSLLDTTTFQTDPFTFNDNDFDMNVPITDTRQQSTTTTTTTLSDKNVQISTNTLNNNNKLNNNNNNNCGVNLNDSVFNYNNNMDVVIDRTAGCSSFNLIEKNEQIDYIYNNCNKNWKNFSISNNNNGDLINNLIIHNNGPINDFNCATTTIVTTNLTTTTTTTATSATLSVSKLHNTSTLTSLKLNNSVNDSKKGPRTVVSSSTTDLNSTISTTTSSSSSSTATSGGNTNGLLQQLGFDVPQNRTKNNKLYAYSSGVGFSSNASSGTLSLHTSAHTLTLNSHSANILEIPITNDPADNKLVNSQLTENASNATNNKKTIVRKNNLIMEVT